MSNYDGVSLSIQRETNMLEILSEWTHIDIANELREWWQITQADKLANKLENETTKDEPSQETRDEPIQEGTNEHVDEIIDEPVKETKDEDIEESTEESTEEIKDFTNLIVCVSD
jgi:hypothetical protein